MAQNATHPTVPKNSRKDQPWTLADLKQLGRVPDSALARRLRRTIAEVVEMREKRRIRLPTPPRRWTAREIRLLGRFNDTELARRLRRKHGDVRRKRVSFRIPPLIPHVTKFRAWTPDEDGRLGTMPLR